MPNEQNLNKDPERAREVGRLYGGRPKGSFNIKTLLNNLLNEEMDFEDVKNHTKHKKKAYEVLYRALIRKAIEGDIQAVKEINQRLEGMPVQENINTNKNMNLDEEQIKEEMKRLETLRKLDDPRLFNNDSGEQAKNADKAISNKDSGKI